MTDLKKKSEKYWKEKLTRQQYKILREAGTEPPFTGELLNNKEEGVYKCAACGQVVFSHKTKYESGSGWPSFFDVIDEGKVEIKQDKSLGMVRMEVLCGRCKSHLGHLFEDGPDPTGKRYCINSAALAFEEK